MSDLFFYGTLRHVPLLELVLGRASGDLPVLEASLADHAVYEVKDQSFPMIVEEAGAWASGVLVRDLTTTDLERLSFYEGGFDYDLRDQTVILSDGSVHSAQVFFPTPGVWMPGSLWSLSDWQETWGALTLLAAEEVMAYFGRTDATRIERSFPAIRGRAWARLMARRRKSDEVRQTARDVVLHNRHHGYVDFFSMESVQLQHRQNSGEMSPVLSRASLVMGDAVIVLPYDPVRDTVLLIEQFRAPLYMIGDPAPWVWEPVAGLIDPLETPEQAAYREAQEEAHIALNALEYAGGAYTTSGSSTEFVYLYIGIGDLTHTVENGGLESEGEDIRSRILPFQEFMDMVDTHVFKDLPMLMLANWLARNRKRLRAG